MFNGADVPELDSSHPLHKQQEIQECDADLLRGVMKVVLEEGEEVAQERMAQPILQHQTQTLVCVCVCVCVGEWEGERGKDVIQELGVFLQCDW